MSVDNGCSHTSLAPSEEKATGVLSRLFKLKENNTSVRTEIVAGITTFMTMAYIIAVNPNLLSMAGMPRDGAGIDHRRLHDDFKLHGHQLARCGRSGAGISRGCGNAVYVFDI